MIDRTTLDLRIAEHSATTARINQCDWRQQREPQRRAMRIVAADICMALAALLDLGRASGRRLTPTA